MLKSDLFSIPTLIVVEFFKREKTRFGFLICNKINLFFSYLDKIKAREATNSQSRNSIIA